MKKLFLFLAAAAFTLVSCSDDDTNNTATFDAAYLTGTWTETAPTPGNNTLTFTGTTAQLNRADGSSEDYTYTVTNNELKLTAQGSESYSLHEATRVNFSTLKLSNMYIQTADAGSQPIITTFKKTVVTTN